MQQFLKPAAGVARTQVVAAKLLEKLLFPFTTRSARLTRVSEGKPFLRLLVASKPEVVEVFGFVFHGTPPLRKPR